jgi:hypothetical protein
MGKITDVYKSLKDSLTGAEPEEADPLQRKYFTVFSSPEGKAVLADMLQDLHAFSVAENDEEVALYNYSRLLLLNIGIIQEGNTADIVNALMPLARAVAVK